LSCLSSFTVDGFHPVGTNRFEREREAEDAPAGPRQLV
jgi:hypothetical protein